MLSSAAPTAARITTMSRRIPAVMREAAPCGQGDGDREFDRVEHPAEKVKGEDGCGREEGSAACAGLLDEIPRLDLVELDLSVHKRRHLRRQGCEEFTHRRWRFWAGIGPGFRAVRSASSPAAPLPGRLHGVVGLTPSFSRSGAAVQSPRPPRRCCGGLGEGSVGNDRTGQVLEDLPRPVDDLGLLEVGGVGVEAGGEVRVPSAGAVVLLVCDERAYRGGDRVGFFDAPAFAPCGGVEGGGPAPLRPGAELLRSARRRLGRVRTGSAGAGRGAPSGFQSLQRRGVQSRIAPWLRSRSRLAARLRPRPRFRSRARPDPRAWQRGPRRAA